MESPESRVALGVNPVWPIHWINLDRATERRTRMQTHLSSLGLVASRSRGSDGTALSPVLLAQLTQGLDRRRFKRALTPGEIGCYLSHIALWTRIAAGPDEVVVVLEDDVRLRSDARETLARLGETAPDWDLLKICHGTSGAQSGLAQVDCIVPRRLPPATMGYAITRPAAARLLETAFPLSRPVDLDLRFWWEHGLCIKVAVPALGWAGETHRQTSEIAPERVAQQHGQSLSRFSANIRYQIVRRLASLYHGGRAPQTRQLTDKGPVSPSLAPALAEALGAS